MPMSVGYDFHAAQATTIPVGGVATIDLGVKVRPPPGYYLQLMSRSGLCQRGVIALGGVIDPDYEDSIKALLYNFGENEFKIEIGKKENQYIYVCIGIILKSLITGDRIIQGLILSFITPSVRVLTEDFKSCGTRGPHGLGSSGI